MRLPALLLTSLILLFIAPAAGSAAQAGSPQEPVEPASPRVGVLRAEGLRAAAKAPVLACPVSLDVRHGAGFGQYVAAGGFTRSPRTQSLDVTVSNRSLSEIGSLDVIVQMRSGKASIMPLVVDESGRGERLRLHFDLTVKVAHDEAASWSVPSSQTVAYVELSKVNYRDGSTWSEAEGGSCSFTPNPMMLISAR